MRRSRFAFALTALPLLVLSSCDWPAVRYGPARTGHNPGETVVGPGNVGQLVKRWSLDTATMAGQGVPVGDPVVASGIVVVTANTSDINGTSFLYARDARTGAASWSKAFPPDPVGRGQQSLSAPAIGNGLVYVGHVGVSGAGQGTIYGGKVTGYAVATGAQQWGSTSFAGGVSGPALANDRVYATALYNTFLIGSFNGLAAWDAGPSGQADFVGPGGGPSRPASAPAIAAGVAYSGTEAGSLVAVDAVGATNCTPAPPEAPDFFPRRSCTAVWSTSTGGPISATPAVSGGVVSVGSDDGKLYAIDAAGCGAATCAPLWTGATGAAVKSSAAVANGVVYVGSDDGRLHAFASAGCGAATCAPLWSYSTGAAIRSSPAVANGMVYVGSDDGRLYAFGLPQ